MRKIALLTLMLLAFPFLASPAPAQDAKAPAAEVHSYRLDFVVKELGEDGRVVNSRAYHTGIATNHRSAIVRTGTRIPIRTTEKGGDIQYQYVDVGINIDCGNAEDVPEGLFLQITTEISSLATPAPTGEALAPIIRQNRWQSDAVLPIGKPTVVFSSDNLENKGKMQVEVTATPMR